MSWYIECKDDYSSGYSDDDDDYDYYYQSDSSEDYDDGDNDENAGHWLSEDGNPFEMYKNGRKETSDTYGEIEGSEGGKAKVCYSVFSNHVKYQTYKVTCMDTKIVVEVSKMIDL